MARWKISISLDGRRARGPLFVRIARAIVEEVRRGRLRRGTALPGERSLAATLGVHRETVAAAYRELRTQGWIVVRPARGAFITDSLPDVSKRTASARGAGRAAEPGFPFESPPETTAPTLLRTRGLLDLSSSTPDPREFPATELARALRRQLRRHAAALLGYGDPRGHPRLRAALASMLETRRGLGVSADELVVVRGAQMGLDLVARALLRPGDAVAVEELGYRPAWAAFQAAGARLVPLPLDGEGVQVTALEAVLRTERIRAVYVTPHHQYPTTVTLSPARRLALLDVTRRHRIAVVEDDYDHEFHYDGRPIHPLASADRDGRVIYVGTLSKSLAPALRIGFVVAPRRFTEALAALRLRVDRQGDAPVEAALADMLDDGLVQRHVWRMHRLYRSRREVFLAALARRLVGTIEFERPAGGLAVWARVLPGTDVEAWARRCRANGVAIRTGRSFELHDRVLPFARFHFAALRESELEEAVRRMEQSVGTRRRCTSRSRNAVPSRNKEPGT